MARSSSTRRLLVVLGDQLNRRSPVFDDLDGNRDLVWMAEVAEEATHVWNHKARIALFLAAMRHFRKDLEDKGYRVEYRELDDPNNRGSFGEELKVAIHKHRPERIVLVEPGEWRVQETFRRVAEEESVPLYFLPDPHFLCSRDEFRDYAGGRKSLLLEHFYRHMRKSCDILMDQGDPVGGNWNLDKQNRDTFGKEGPGELPSPTSSRRDDITREVLALVEKKFSDHPGSLEHFHWPVTPAQAKRALDEFIAERLPKFGPFQDAMWTGEPFLYHSRLASAMNLKILDPRDVIAAAEEAYGDGAAPLNSVEGFIRQILGWREFVRGIYWLHMPDYLEMNALEARQDLPAFYWTAETDMNCLRHTIQQTLDYGYAHHIQRLMVTGLFALLLGVEPKQVHEWYLAVYVDAVEWVELPNTLGMSQYGDGGIMATKPYAATGKYIKRMSNYCAGCRYNPDQRTGEKACPFSTLYWDFLSRHKGRLEDNQRMALQLKNLDRVDKGEMREIRRQADAIREDPGLV